MLGVRGLLGLGVLGSVLWPIVGDRCVGGRWGEVCVCCVPARGAPGDESCWQWPARWAWACCNAMLPGVLGRHVMLSRGSLAAFTSAKMMVLHALEVVSLILKCGDFFFAVHRPEKVRRLLAPGSPGLY